MTKPRKTLHLSLPRYPIASAKRKRKTVRPGLRWRRLVFNAIRRQADKRGVTYEVSDRVKVDLLVYLSERQMEHFDVDNLVKHVGDALQGQLAGRGKKYQHRRAVLPNDWQISLWKVEKVVTSTANKYKSRLLVQRYKPRIRTKS